MIGIGTSAAISATACAGAPAEIEEPTNTGAKAVAFPKKFPVPPGPKSCPDRPIWDKSFEESWDDTTGRFAAEYEVHTDALADHEECVAARRPILEAQAINSLEPLNLNLDIVPTEFRTSVERYLKMDKIFCTGFAASALELKKLELIWPRVSGSSAQMAHYGNRLAKRLGQIGSVPAFAMMNALFGHQLILLPSELLTVIQKDLSRKEFLYTKYIGNALQTLGVSLGAIELIEERERSEEPPIERPQRVKDLPEGWVQ